ncbi:phosphotransferase [Janibacter corallicola]|uniref:phosphotransferase n=1 Tax=Janibacter corallicola TaxID=415212 RepID=UPI00082FC567|nr:phosphotransferase [Janibacter corallicola]
MTSRGPLALAALASAAVSGLDPSSVEGVVPQGALDPYEVAFVQDHDHHRWVIRSPRTAAASAQLEQSAALLSLLARRLTMPVPAVKGWVALPEGGRAAVHPYLTGRMVLLEDVAAGSRLAVGIGRTLAQLHNLEPGVYEESGVPVYDTETHRTRRLADLDRAAGTGRVPARLLDRWESDLQDRQLWSFTPTPTHGAVGEHSILATPDDGEEPDVKALLGWEEARVADPADDFAELVGALSPEALDTVLESYAHARIERPDAGLLTRARLVHQMQLARTLVAVIAAGDETGAERQASRLRELDEELAPQEQPADGDEATGSPGTAGTAAAGATAAGAEAKGAASSPEESPEQPRDGTAAEDTGAEDDDPSVEDPAAQDPADDHSSAEDPAAEDTGAEDGEDDSDAVEVEGMHLPTPVAVTEPAEEPEHPEEPETPAADETPAAAEDSGTPGATGRITPAAPDQSEPDEPEPDEPESGQPARGNDHDTQEITPLVEDDTDDVIDPSR